MSNRKQIVWRRNKTHELLVKGHNQVQIANILQVSEATISYDVAYLRELSRKNMKNHLYDRLPHEYENCMSGVNQILKMSWEIATRDLINDSVDNVDSDKSKVDDKTRLQALALANECYKYKMDLVTNGVVIADAVKFVQQKKEEIEKMQERDASTLDRSSANTNSGYNSNNNPVNRIF